VLLASVASGASTVDLLFNSVNPGIAESVSFNSGGGFAVAGTGTYNLTASNSTTSLVPNGSLTAYCVEGTIPTPESPQPPQTYTVLGPGSYVAPASVPNFVSNMALVNLLFNQHYTTSLNQNDTAALQLAIWEVLYDGSGGSLGTGVFQVNSTGLANTEVVTAQSWVTNINTTASINNYTLYQLANPDFQDFVIGINAVPLPAALPAGAGTLMVILAFRKWRGRARG
jgi:hypothetical protein